MNFFPSNMFSYEVNIWTISRRPPFPQKKEKANPTSDYFDEHLTFSSCIIIDFVVDLFSNVLIKMTPQKKVIFLMAGPLRP